MQNTYVIITPAFNEAAYIKATIESVLAQTARPLLWMIVDDGSTDKTAEIVKHYAREHSWIQYIYRQKESGQTYYASNVYAIQHGLNQIQNSKLKTQNYQFIAILDADIELCPDYYEKIVEKFAQYPRLGIATGTYLEKENNDWIEARIDRRSTPKAIQVFRRECYWQCGGYLPLKYGGEDSGMEMMARMNGWQTWSFNDITVKHLRPVGTGDGKVLLAARFRIGLADYCLGTHPVFMILKTIKRCFWERPFVLSGLARLMGFVYGSITREKRQISPHAIQYLRKEQLRRLWKPKSAVNFEQTYKTNKKFCVVASAGGHMSELLQLQQLWCEKNAFFVSTTEVIRDKLQQKGATWIVGECNRQNPIKMIGLMIKCLKIVRKNRPDVVISTGAAVGFWMCFWGKLFGAKIVWIDSIANTKILSMSGRLIRPFSDLILSQWPDVAEKYPNVEYVGELI